MRTRTRTHIHTHTHTHEIKSGFKATKRPHLGDKKKREEERWGWDRTDLVQHPQRIENVVKTQQVSSPAGGHVPGWHFHAYLGMVVGSGEGAGALTVDVCRLTPAHDNIVAMVVVPGAQMQCIRGDDGAKRHALIQAPRALAPVRVTRMLQEQQNDYRASTQR
eukprot:1158532-Pelagomonas_calceolata.AAC.11